MSVIIRLQNLPWSANALDIRNFFRGLSIPEGGVHIVGGELGDAFIAFSTDEDARQAMMHDGGKLKEIQVKLFLSSRSEMHKVIETARNTVPLLSMPAAPAPAPAALSAQPAAALGPFATALGNSQLLGLGVPGIPGLGNPLEIPQPAVIEPPPPMLTHTPTLSPDDKEDDYKPKRESKDRRRSRSRSRSREKKDRSRGRRDRSRSRERRRRDRSRSRDRRERKRDRKDRSRSRDRSPRRARGERRSGERTNGIGREEPVLNNKPPAPFMMRQENGPVAPPAYGPRPQLAPPPVPYGVVRAPFPQSPTPAVPERTRFDTEMADTLSRIQELGKKRNPHAFQGEPPTNGMPRARGGARGGRREGRPSRFEEDTGDRCVVLKNAPNHTSYGDVRRYFPYMIDKDGIKMINSAAGRRTGTIFVRFAESRSKHLALQAGNNELKGALVTVEALPDEAFDSAVDSFLPFRDNETIEPIESRMAEHEPYTVLKVADLPVFVQEHEIVKCFGDYSLLSISLTACRASRSKIALVQFVKPEDAREAYERRDRYLFGRRKPVVTIAEEADLRQTEEPESYSTAPEPYPKVPEPYPSMPEPTPPAPEPPRDPRQRRAPSGPLLPGLGAAVPPSQFLAPQFPGQYPPRPQFPAPSFPMNSFSMPVPESASARNTWPPADEGPADCVLVKGLPPDATDRTIVEFLSWARAAPARVHIMLDTGGAPTGDCFCEFRDPEDASRAASCHGRELAGRRVTVDLVTRALMEDALDGPRERRPPPDRPQERNSFADRGGFPDRGARGFGRGGGFRPPRGFGRGRARGRGGAMRPPFEPPHHFEQPHFEQAQGQFDHAPLLSPAEEPDLSLEDFGAPGCVVSMENVPFRASVPDILSFFGDFQLSQDDIIRRFNDRGQPTGDARVAFRTPFDAQRAVTTRQLATIHERRISLCII